ncbi:MAG: alpha/beta hydrolase family protein [Fimbriimonas sp.]|nr:alpha/beta hydrolase family protein [Fimbriimonas sp.]
MATLNTLQYANDRVSGLSREFAWQQGCGEAWKHELRARLSECIGLPKQMGTSLDIEVIERRSMDGYDRETITFVSQPGMRVFAYVLTPHGITGLNPAVVCVPGHGPGVDVLVGELPHDYQNQFALQCVGAGFVVVAIEQASFGRRMTPGSEDRGSSCMRDSMAALMLGETMIGWRAFDAMRALDLLRTRPEVDPERIAVLGISGGGLTSFWAACLDERFAAAVVSGYFNTFFDSILSIEHCVDNFAPGLAKVVEMPDMAALIAPRKLFVESGTEDPIFPAHAFLRACGTARAIYADAGVPASFASEHFPGEHVFWGRKAIPHLAEWFGIKTTS